MKIWLLSHTYFPATGGVENYLRSVAGVFLRQGHEVTIICRRHLAGLPAEEESEGIRVVRHPDFTVPRHKLLVKHLYLTRRIAFWLEQSGLAREGVALSRFPAYQYALSRLENHIPGFYLPAAVWPVLAAQAACAGNRKEKMFVFLWKSQMTFLEKSALEKANRVITFSRNMSDQIRRKYRVPLEKIVINPPGVDIKRFRPRPRDPELLQKSPLSADLPQVLFVGRLSPEKNLFFLLEVLDPLLRRKKVNLILVGNGPLAPALSREIKGKGLSGSVWLAGPTAEPERYYSLGDIFVSPSLYESFGQSLLEAMASGLAVVALRNLPPRVQVAAPEIVDEGRSGFCVPPRVGDFREKVAELLVSARPREEMGKRGREICAAKFTWERHAEGIIQDA